jgi:hypothetical protein
MVTVLSMLRLPIACLVEVKLAYHVDPFPFIRFPVQYVFDFIWNILFSSLIVLISHDLLLL